MWALLLVGYAEHGAERQVLAGPAPLAPALATQTALDPTTSLALGVFAFNERIHETTVGTVGALAGMALMIAGTVVLVSGPRRGSHRRRRGDAGTGLVHGRAY